LEDLQHDENQAAYCKLLFVIISADIRPHVAEVKDFVDKGVINFGFFWPVIKPELEMYSLVDGQHWLYCIYSAKYVHLPGGI
jgi:hypothetical protein